MILPIRKAMFISVPFFRPLSKSSRITTTLYRTTKIPKEWEERGETITQTTSKQRTGGATGKKDRPELTADGRLTVVAFDFHFARNADNFSNIPRARNSQKR